MMNGATSLIRENPHHVYQPYRLPGQQYDEESGLYYNRNRYYDPLQGRYARIRLGRWGGGIPIVMCLIIQPSLLTQQV